MASAAVLMAGLVIATMLAFNARLQSALSPSPGEAGAPVLKVVSPAAAPVLQKTAAPSVANSPVPAAVVVTAPELAVAPVATKTVPAAAPKPVAEAITTSVGNPSTVKIPATPVALPTVTLPAAPAVSLPVVVTVPALAAASVTVTAPDSDLGDTTASSGETHHKDRSSGGDLAAASQGNDSQAKDHESDEGKDDTAAPSDDTGKSADSHWKASHHGHSGDD
jgi:hypothetical protein